MKYLSIYILLLLAIVACQKSEYEVTPDVVDFYKQNIWETRGTPATNENHNEFYVFAHQFAAATNPKPAFNANYMNNVKVTKNGDGNWDYSPKQFWPESTERVEFMAYSPQPTDSNGLSNLNISSEGHFCVTYTPPADITHQPDLMLAKTEPLSNVAVNLTFKHLLAQVSFSVKGNPNKRIKAVILENIVKSGTYSSGTDTWAYSTDWDNKTWFAIADWNNDIVDVAPSESSQNITAPDAHLFMLPQTVAAGNIVIILMKDVTKPNEPDVRDTLTFATNQVWTAGKRYNYSIGIPSVEQPDSTILDIDAVDDYYYNGGYPEGDTWIVVDTVPEDNVSWWRFNEVVKKASAAGVEVNLVFPNLTTLDKGPNTFNASQITSLSAPNITYIPTAFFDNCSKLKSIDLPRVKTIEERAFYNSTSLQRLSLDSVEIIGDAAFQGDTLLTIAKLPRVKSIGNWAFGKCPQLITMELATDQNVVLQSVAEIFESNKYTVDLTIGSDNAVFITTKNGYPALKVGEGATNPFKSITQVPN